MRTRLRQLKHRCFVCTRSANESPARLQLRMHSIRFLLPYCWLKHTKQPLQLFAVAMQQQREGSAAASLLPLGRIRDVMATRSVRTSISG